MSKLLQLLLVGLCAGLALGQDSIGCFVPGECLGSTYIGISIQEDATDCLDACHQELGCQYFTYYENEDACIYFISCSNLSEEGCTGCISGDNECEARQCDLAGLCDGRLVDFGTIATQQQCINSCDSNPDCGWWTYNTDTKFCLLSEDCAYLDSDYENSLAGEKGCTAEPIDPPAEEDLSKVLLIGGYNAGGHSSQVDLVNLNNATDCEDVNSFPNEIEETIAVNLDGVTWVCGGAGPGDMGFGDSLAQCWSLESESGNWSQEAPMSQGRANHQAIVWEDGNMWVLGGRNTAGGRLETTEIFNGTEWTDGPDMPHALEGHCVALISRDYAILTGGNDGQDTNMRSAYLYNYFNDTWSPLLPMIDGRSEHICEVVEDAERGLELIVAGGGYDLTSTDIFSFPTQSWRSGPALPKPLTRAASVAVDNTILIFGGGDGSTNSFYDDVWEYDVANEQWLARTDLNMTTGGRYDHAAVLMDSADLDCIAA